MRSGLAFCLGLAPVCASFAHADDLPVIVTYELNKRRQDDQVLARNPKAFWVRQIVARIEDRVPKTKVPRKEAVTVRIAFVVARDGRLVSKSLAGSSGDAEADKIAMAMLDGAQPFPPMPEGLGDSELAFTLPVRFR